MNTKIKPELAHEIFSYIYDRGGAEKMSTNRGLSLNDVKLFCQLVTQHPGKKVRVYSYQGFLPRSYNWSARIWYIETQNEGFAIGTTGAQRRYGAGPHATVANRKVC